MPSGSNSTLLLANDYVNARPTLDAAAANRIVLGVEAGNGNQTGYSASAYYSFSNFVFSTPSIVTGVTISSVNIDGLGTLGAPGSQVSFDPLSRSVTVMSGTSSSMADCRMRPGRPVWNHHHGPDIQAVPGAAGTWMLIVAEASVVVVVGRQRHCSCVASPTTCRSGAGIALSRVRLGYSSGIDAAGYIEPCWEADATRLRTSGD